MWRQNGATECFIRTLLYLGCQRIRWKISAGHQVAQFYLGRKGTGWLSPNEGKLSGQNFKQPFITWPWRLSCRLQGRRDRSLSGVLKTIVQVQAQHAEDHHNNTYSELINSPYQESQMSNPRLFITCRKDDGGGGGGGSGGEKMWVIVRCKKKKKELHYSTPIDGTDPHNLSLVNRCCQFSTAALITGLNEVLCILQQQS